MKKVTQYIDTQGRRYEVWYKSQHGQYRYRIHSWDGRTHRVLPRTIWRTTPEAAEAELERLAKVNGWNIFKGR